jgi:hypothetical protein
MDDARTLEPAAATAAGGLESLEITIDAVDAEASAGFWAAALGYERLYDRPTYIVLGPAGGAGPRVLVQRVASVASEKSPVHLDLRVRDTAGEVARLEALGAAVDRVVAEAGTTWTVMLDPGGTPFCVCPSRGGGGAG